MILVSPNPIAAPFKDASKTSIASDPRKPAEVIKNNASAASPALLPVSTAIFFAVSPIFATSSAPTPTNAVIEVIDLSKSNAILPAATPTATNGNVNPTVIDLPTFCILDPNAESLELAEDNAEFNFLLSPTIFTLKSCCAIILLICN